MFSVNLLLPISNAIFVFLKVSFITLKKAKAVGETGVATGGRRCGKHLL